MPFFVRVILPRKQLKNIFDIFEYSAGLIWPDKQPTQTLYAVLRAT